jgi:hypothetical protein
MRIFPSARAIFAIFGVALACAFATLLLPTNDYQRYQLLRGTIHDRAHWIYERIHFDPTPIDVVIIGSSRTGAGVDPGRLGRDTGLNVVNFSLPEAGRNINHAIIEEMLKAKQPRLLVIGVTEKPSRFGHSAFRYLASPADLLNPGYLGNFNWLPDLAYLPYRQLYLFAAWLAPGAMGMPKHFDPARYDGPAYDTTQDIVMPDGHIKRTDIAAPMAELLRGVKKLEAGNRPAILPARFADIEFGDDRSYVRRIVALAKARGIRVAFLAIPYYTGTSDVQEAPLYERFGPIWNAGFFASHPADYSDYAHLNRGAARQLTDWLAPKITAALAPSPRPQPAPFSRPPGEPLLPLQKSAAFP